MKRNYQQPELIRDMRVKVRDNLPRNIKDNMELCGFKTVKDLSAATGISVTTLYHAINGLSSPQAEKVLILAKTFGVSVELLCTGEEW